MQKSIRHHARKARAKISAYDLSTQVWNITVSYVLLFAPVAGSVLVGAIEKYIL